ncbi:MAG: hypothetical protein LBM38_02575 [Clostridiales bacterium]|jgi:V/A-type H+-transporting ATPase subunit F|nr:hypothetical protein [Clostridiales bacterium]
MSTAITQTENDRLNKQGSQSTQNTTNNISKVAIIGMQENILPYNAVGITTLSVTDFATAKHAFSTLLRDNYAIIFIENDVALMIQDEIHKHDGLSLPAIVILPSVNSTQPNNADLGMDNITKMVEKAVGSNIL